MRFLKSVLFGMTAAFIAAALCLIAEFAFTEGASGSSRRTVSVGDYYFVFGGPVYFLFAAVLGFVVGFYWQFRRAARIGFPATRH
jgi:hypothetical protein